MSSSAARARHRARSSRPSSIASAPPEGVVPVHFLTDSVGVGEPPTTRYRHRVFYVGRDVRDLGATGRIDYLPLALPDVPRTASARAGCALDVAHDPGRAARRRRHVQPRHLRRRHARGRARGPHRHRRGQSRHAPDARRQPHPRRAASTASSLSTAPIVGVRARPGRRRRRADRPLRRAPHRGRLDAAGRPGPGAEPDARPPDEPPATSAIHSDVITEPVADLVGAGVVTGPVVASWAMGTRRLYDLLDGDARFELRPIDAGVRPRRDRRAGDADGLGHAGLQRRPDRAGVHGAPRRRRSTAASRPARRSTAAPSPPRTAWRSSAWPRARPQGGRRSARSSSATSRSRSRAPTSTGSSRSTAPRTCSAARWPSGRWRWSRSRTRTTATRCSRRRSSAGSSAAGQHLRSRTAYPVGEERDLQLRDGSEVRVRPTRTTDAARCRSSSSASRRRTSARASSRSSTSLTD